MAKAMVVFCVPWSATRQRYCTQCEVLGSKLVWVGDVGRERERRDGRGEGGRAVVEVQSTHWRARPKRMGHGEQKPHTHTQKRKERKRKGAVRLGKNERTMGEIELERDNGEGSVL